MDDIRMDMQGHLYPDYDIFGVAFCELLLDYGDQWRSQMVLL